MVDGALPSSARLRIDTPVAGADAVGMSPHTHSVVEITVRNATFVADSVTAHLARRGFEVHELTEVEGEAGTTLRIAIDRETDPGVLARLRVELDDVLDDVCDAVTDWPAMRDHVRDLAEELRQSPPPGVASADAAEAAAFLEWLDDDHFTFVGAAEYRIEGVGNDARLVAVEERPLGVARRRVLPEPGARGETLFAPFVLTLTKAGARSTVHRAAPLDDVRVRCFDRSGAPSGEWRFVGLYTAPVYSDSVTRTPVLRRKVAMVVAASGAPPPSHEARALTNVLETLPREELFRLPVETLTELARGIASVGERRRVRLFVTPDEFGRFVSCLVYLHRDRYTTTVRAAIIDVLRAAYAATCRRLLGARRRVGDGAAPCRARTSGRPGNPARPRHRCQGRRRGARDGTGRRRSRVDR